ncbi:MAG: tRNA (adenosine(37)-N6)-threonylcarbamoyltransferase complex dimerization subunit type 1 TsaB [Steroidobacteraceae bacterium]|jgi:tRNA threonylcarbamoyladenosine biosynthesis protein TsaB
MRVLALDTATEACSVALVTDTGVIGRYAEVGRGHAEEILGMVKAVLGEAGIPLGALDGIAAGIGPGSFTGVRISVSVAQGLAFGAVLPVIPLTSLETLAWRAIGDEPATGAGPGVGAGAGQALACLDARMGEVYWGCFAADRVRGVALLGTLQVGPAATVRWAEAVPYRGIGRGFAAYPELGRLPGLELAPRDAEALPDARDMARLGVLRLAAGAGVDPAELKPQYVRDKVALTEAERLASK